MRPGDQPRGCLRFLDDYREAGRMAWEQCKPPLFVIAVGLVHFPVSFHPDLGGYRWVVVAVGSLSTVVGVACLHLLMLGLERMAISRARVEAKAARKAAMAEDEQVSQADPNERPRAEDP